MREPKISFVSELKAQIINDLRRLLHSIMILTNHKSQPTYFSNGFIYGGAEACKAWGFCNYSGHPYPKIKSGLPEIAFLIAS